MPGRATHLDRSDGIEATTEARLEKTPIFWTQKLVGAFRSPILPFFR